MQTFNRIYSKPNMRFQGQEGYHQDKFGFSEKATKIWPKRRPKTLFFRKEVQGT